MQPIALQINEEYQNCQSDNLQGAYRNEQAATPFRLGLLFLTYVCTIQCIYIISLKAEVGFSMACTGESMYHNFGHAGNAMNGPSGCTLGNVDKSMSWDSFHICRYLHTLSLKSARYFTPRDLK